MLSAINLFAAGVIFNFNGCVNFTVKFQLDSIISIKELSRATIFIALMECRKNRHVFSLRLLKNSSLQIFVILLGTQIEGEDVAPLLVTCIWSLLETLHLEPIHLPRPSMAKEQQVNRFPQGPAKTFQRIQRALGPRNISIGLLQSRNSRLEGRDQVTRGAGVRMKS